MFDKFADSKLRLQILNNLQINPQILQIRKPVLTYIYKQVKSVHKQENL